MSEEERRQIREIARNPQSVQVVLYARRAGRNPIDEYRRLQMHENLAGEFASICRAVAEPMADQWGEIAFDPGHEPQDGQVLRIGINEQEAGAVASLRNAVRNPENLAFLDRTDEHFLGSLQYYAIVLTNGDRNAVFVRKFKRSMRLLRSGGLHLILSQGVFEKLEEEVFRFDSRIDCCVWQDVCFVPASGLGDFLSMFDYYERYGAQAVEIVGRFAQILPIAELDEFQRAVGSDPRMMRAIVSAGGNVGPLGEVSMVEIQAHAESLGLEGLVIRDPDNGELKLAFDKSPSRRWQLVHLLNDAYVKSVLIQNRFYEANSKRKIQAVHRGRGNGNGRANSRRRNARRR